MQGKFKARGQRVVEGGRPSRAIVVMEAVQGWCKGRETVRAHSIRDEPKCSPLVIPVDLPVSTAPDSSQAPRRRALLVGVKDIHIPEWDELQGPFEDVRLWTSLLTGTYGYRMEDIVVMMDDPSVPPDRQPTRSNLIREMRLLVKDAAPGDQLTFTFSGHSTQQPTSEVPNLEDDNQDEVLLTCDGKQIVDNVRCETHTDELSFSDDVSPTQELKAILVDPLPAGCSLTAFLDSCHSGTMLDLQHYKCNRVWFPWVSRGERDPKTLRAAVLRRYANLARPLSHIIPLSAGLRNATELPSRHRHRALGIAPPPPRASSLPGMLTRMLGRLTLPAPREPDADLDFPRCTSPVQYACDGWCERDEAQRAHLPTAVSIAACMDAQQAWEGVEETLTKVACRYLKDHPHATYRELMAELGHSLHHAARKIHKFAQGQKSDVRFDMVNFQTPVVRLLALFFRAPRAECAAVLYAAQQPVQTRSRRAYSYLNVNPSPTSPSTSPQDTPRPDSMHLSCSCIRIATLISSLV
ncbi:hypothetical protein FA95DRAFT_1595643 [Auriscalpium vulgare]|uniref:Uncharacterized protein n=1 Tax=Auriscalpium vulgare TaxID=40419 RepID=A0ACB8RTY6_9AGAM|nr:hypothetical protein FA95DRAFT_1595643 [Auriscalpium vulgare]